MIATLEFSLPEEQEEHRYALAGVDLGAVIIDLDAELRTLQKHGGKGAVSVEVVRERLRVLLIDRDLSWVLG